MIFLAIAIAGPLIIIVYNGSLNSSNIIVDNPSGTVTGGNTTAAQGFSAPQGIDNSIPATIAIVFAILFVATFYFALRQPSE